MELNSESIHKKKVDLNCRYNYETMTKTIHNIFTRKQMNSVISGDCI